LSSPIHDRNFILFRSELFLYDQADEHIDVWFVGGDCAGWIYARLLPHPNVVRETDPVMEDWGWYASVKTQDTDTSISLLVYAWPHLEQCWLIGLDPRRRLLRRQPAKTLCDAIECIADGIEGIIDSDDRFESFGWHEQNPFDTGITDPRQSLANNCVDRRGDSR
jgi:hypothetical protein